MNNIAKSKARIKKSLEKGFLYHHLALERSEKFLKKHDSERLPMFVLYVDLVGSTKMSSDLNPDSLNVIIRTFSQEMSYVIESFGGYVLKFIGDAVLAYFPDNTKNNQTEEIMNCSEIMNKIVNKAINPILERERLPKLQIKISVDYGDCSIVRYGANKNRSHIDLIGLTLNLAAKMQNYAKPNQTIIGETVFKRLNTKTKKMFKKKQTDSKSWIFHQLKIKTPYSIYYRVSNS